MMNPVRAIVREGRIQLLEEIDLPEGTEVLVTPVATVDARKAIIDLEESPSDALVCHYTCIEVAVAYILSSTKVRLSPFGKMNDPRETHARRFESSDFTGADRPLDAHAHVEAANRLMVENVKLFSATRDFYQEPSSILARGFGRPRMWAQYGRRHEGVCLLFDREVLEKRLNEAQNDQNQTYAHDVCYDPDVLQSGWQAFHLDYDEAKSLGMENFWRNHVQRFWKALFFRKHQDWRDEMEWRFAVVDDVDDFTFAPFDDALRYIVAGAFARDENVSALKRMAGSVPVLRLRFEPWKDDFVINVCD